MVKKVKKYCETILKTTKCNQLPFHNLAHTQQVVRNVRTISKRLDLAKEEVEPILIAAWFHDTGFCEAYQGHEEVSIQLAKAFLTENSYAAKNIDTVVTCIMATKIPQNPLTKYAEILSDADIFHISTPEFFYRKLLLRREWELVLNKFSTDLEWHLLNLDFLHNHQFFTTYGKKVLMKGQDINEAKVKNLIQLYK